MFRFHLFEFEDQPWFPNILRRGITDYLQFASDKTNLYKPATFVIFKGLEKSNSKQIVDLCSGGGGGIVKIIKHIQEKYPDVKVVLTDKYPNIEAFENLAKQSNGVISYVDTPIDATDIPKELQGFRTQFVSFHHFSPKNAFKILDNAAKSKAAIGIFEVTERTFINFIAMLLTPFVVMAVTPFIKPFSWSRLFFTYIIPAIPFFTMWDGLVSVLRTYTVEEINEMISKIDEPGYNWEVGYVGKHPRIIYILGYHNN